MAYEMIWRHPEAFLLFLPFLAVLFWIQRKKLSSGLFYSSLSLFEGMGEESLRQKLYFIPFALKVMALTLMILALARPLSPQDREEQDRPARDLLLLLDISMSMLVEDMEGRVSRLEASKKVISDFVEGRTSDRIGLIVFSGESFTEVPLTFDHSFLKSRLKRIQPLEELKQGTAIGVALANGLARLQSSPTKSRAIVLLTDGDNNAGFIDPETSTHIARESGIKIYSIGLGTKSGFNRIRKKDSMGRTSIYKIKTRVNKELLKKISSQTGGVYFSAENPQALKQIFKKIDQLESYQDPEQKQLRQKELFEAFLSPGIVLYLLSLLLSLTVFFKEV